MRTISRSLTLALLLLAFTLPACGEDDDPSTMDPTWDVVSGFVVEIDDMVPVDGGVSVVLRQEDDSTLTTYLPSIYTFPEPDAQTLRVFDRIYPVILELDPGDLVIAKGVLRGESLRLMELRNLFP